MDVNIVNLREKIILIIKEIQIKCVIDVEDYNQLWVIVKFSCGQQQWWEV